MTISLTVSREFSHVAGIIPTAFYITVLSSGGLLAAYTTAACSVFTSMTVDPFWML